MQLRFKGLFFVVVYFYFLWVCLSVPVQTDWLESLVSEMTCYVSSGSLNSPMSLCEVYYCVEEIKAMR